jgi:hypothetical protein
VRGVCGVCGVGGGGRGLTAYTAASRAASVIGRSDGRRRCRSRVQKRCAGDGGSVGVRGGSDGDGAPAVKDVGEDVELGNAVEEADVGATSQPSPCQAEGDAQVEGSESHAYVASGVRVVGGGRGAACTLLCRGVCDGGARRGGQSDGEDRAESVVNMG